MTSKAASLYFSCMRYLGQRQNRLFFRPIWLGVHGLMAIYVRVRGRGIYFPEPLNVHWTKTWRYRFEFLAELNELGTVEVFKTVLRPGMVAIDVGAHIGYFTRMFASLVGPNGRVLAIEAHPENMASLRANISLTGHRNVEYIQCLAGNREGSELLHIGKGHSNHSIFREMATSGAHIELPLRRLDSILKEKNISRIDLIKIDCEGSEPAVISGLEETLIANPQCILVVEINARALAAAASSPQNFFEQLDRIGFVVRQITDDGRLVEPDLGAKKTYNCIAVHSGALSNLEEKCCRAG
jgi:FkbM family methyltransferase